MRRQRSGPSARIEAETLDALLLTPLALRAQGPLLEELMGTLGARYVLAGQVTTAESIGLRMWVATFPYVSIPISSIVPEGRTHLAMSLRVVDLQTGTVVADATKVRNGAYEVGAEQPIPTSDVKGLMNRLFRKRERGR